MDRLNFELKYVINTMIDCQCSNYWLFLSLEILLSCRKDEMMDEMDETDGVNVNRFFAMTTDNCINYPSDMLIIYR